MSGREVARRAGVSHPTAAAVLGVLLEQGIVTVKWMPRAAHYELNRRHVLNRRLRDLFAWEGSAFERLLADLSRRIATEVPAARAAFVFGSAARGEMGPDSDVDVAVACPAANEETAWEGMQRVAEWVRARYGVRVSPLVRTGTPRSLGQTGRPGAELWRRILEEGIPLLAASTGDGSGMSRKART